ncbi:MAG: hypothetical protein S4CHLAM45_11380 [Chlamydiales bacterium]|nr:hypothetical protein [Chlamydiales bacterium]MCH9619630.1 hypothetical protein [Chlamydiales bacterium]MCH9623236.1 hypothetical protein [Chlamydiales bacterium]
MNIGDLPGGTAPPLHRKSSDIGVKKADSFETVKKVASVVLEILAWVTLVKPIYLLFKWLFSSRSTETSEKTIPSPVPSTKKENRDTTRLLEGVSNSEEMPQSSRSTETSEKSTASLAKEEKGEVTRLLEGVSFPREMSQVEQKEWATKIAAAGPSSEIRNYTYAQLAEAIKKMKAKGVPPCFNNPREVQHFLGRLHSVLKEL